MLSLALSGFAIWQVQHIRAEQLQVRTELAQRLAQMEESLGRAQTQSQKNLEDLLQEQNRLSALEAKVAESQGQAAALAALHQELSRGREDRFLAEVEQMINIAAQQLQLAGNIEAAQIALQSAESRLLQFNQGQFVGLQRAVSQDLEALRAMPRIDVAGVGRRLEVLGEQVESLPFAHDALPLAPQPEQQVAVKEDEARSWWHQGVAYAKALAYDLGRELGGLVRIERLDQPGPVLLTPEQSRMLKENVRIRLFTARLAVLTQDGQAYRTDLTQAGDWVKRYFDEKSPRVQAFSAELENLLKEPVTVEHVALTRTLSALRSTQMQGARASEALPRVRTE